MATRLSSSTDELSRTSPKYRISTFDDDPSGTYSRYRISTFDDEVSSTSPKHHLSTFDEEEDIYDDDSFASRMDSSIMGIHQQALRNAISTTSIKSADSPILTTPRSSFQLDRHDSFIPTGNQHLDLRVISKLYSNVIAQLQDGSISYNVESFGDILQSSFNLTDITDPTAYVSKHIIHKYAIFLNKLKSMNIAFFYFPVFKSIVNNFDRSKEDTIEIGNLIFLPFTWANIVKYATTDQLQVYDNFRRSYVSSLFHDCISDDQCNAAIIGSYSTKSDLDFEITSHNVASNIIKFYMRHYCTFNMSIERMFDVNVYGASWHDRYDFHPELFQHVIASIRHAIHDFPSYFSEASKRFANMYAYIRHSIDDCETRRIKLYAHALDYFTNKNTQVAYTICKFIENEVYFSIGAYIHVVHPDDLPVDATECIVDSILDNVGFVLDHLSHIHDFSLSDIDATSASSIFKIAKYMRRILDGLESLDIDILTHSKEIIVDIDNFRKLNTPFNAEVLIKFETMLGSLSSNSQENNITLIIRQTLMLVCDAVVDKLDITSESIDEEFDEIYEFFKKFSVDDDICPSNVVDYPDCNA